VPAATAVRRGLLRAGQSGAQAQRRVSERRQAAFV
jgi:hypothetical protein